MESIRYFAVIEPTDTGYSVHFPDLPGCITVGKNFNHSLAMAEEALGLHLWGMERDGDTIPAPTEPPYECETGGVVTPVSVYPQLVKGNIESRGVRKSLTIPYWLNKLAEENKVNFSYVLQNALKEMLKVNNIKV
jgi:predicted RNase H-like HicB family nuclease